jgi:hypothetical protein
MDREIDPELNLLQNLLLFIRRDTMHVFLRDYNLLYAIFVCNVNGPRSSPLQDDKGYMVLLQPIIFPFLANHRAFNDLSQ